ncbi:hypothetical protein [Chryseosolibacter indicus]|uniref:Uncharacterized protein n=1 Tax=Chryseosolibacter indicus TaxID=2782351 RepID=A0ABS5VPB0_9BACT|nr:hypothetical protein [Chryseosolibacter indicus]MBT1702637.1 hypothetical protein [Chryseosolibacter indicus]
MFKTFMKIAGLAILLLLLVNTSWAQNSKGDRPQNDRGARFSKSDKKNKSVKRKQDKKRTTYLKSYKPRKQGKGGEQAGKPMGNIRSSEPSDRQKPVRSGRRVRPESASGKTSNVFRQNDHRFVHNNSRKPKSEQKPVSNRSTLARLEKLQTPEKPPGRKIRVTPRSASRSFTARKSTNVMAHYSRPRQRAEKAYTRDIAGRKLRTKNFETKRPTISVISRGKKLSRSGKGRTAVGSERNGRFRNYSSRARSSSNPYPPSGTSVRTSSGRPHAGVRSRSNKSIFSGASAVRSQGNPRGKKRKVTPRSASGSFIARRSTNTWAQFPRPKRRSERAYTGDIAGKPLRTRNYETPRPGLINQPRRIKTGIRQDRPYRGPASGGYSSRTKPGERAWQGDIAGRSIRGIKKPKHDTAGKRVGPGIRSASNLGKTRAGRAIPGTRPGIGANGIGGFKGNLRGGRPLKGGGSVSGRLWNNKETPLNGRTPGIGADKIGGFQGNIKSKRPGKGGGSVSGKLWNNNGSPVHGRVPGRGAEHVGNFQGNIKTQRPDKGGGSVSGQLWNNKEKPLLGRVPGVGADKVGDFQGNIKNRRPDKGGGSVSGKLWNNKEKPIEVRMPGEGTQRGGKFGGDIRISRFKKAYIKNPNAAEEAMAKRRPSKPVYQEGGLQVKVARRPYVKNDNSAELALKKLKPTESTIAAGGLQTKVGRRSYVTNDNSSELALKKLKPSQAALATGGLQTKVRTRRYIINPNSSELALKKLKPTEATIATAGLQNKVARRRYVKNPNSAELALLKLQPTKTTQQAGELQVKVKQYKYIHNRSSNEFTLKVREPGKAFARATDYQGNIRMQKFRLFDKNRELHPDARFVKINKNNVAEEKDAATNLKLWWARLFKKNETQPDHLKEKGKKPRYDKGEAGLWYD